MTDYGMVFDLPTLKVLVIIAEYVPWRRAGVVGGGGGGRGYVGGHLKKKALSVVWTCAAGDRQIGQGGGQAARQTTSRIPSSVLTGNSAALIHCAQCGGALRVLSLHRLACLRTLSCLSTGCFFRSFFPPW